MYFHNSLIPRGACFLLPLEINKKLPQGETSQNKMHFRGQGQSIKSEKYTC